MLLSEDHATAPEAVLVPPPTEAITDEEQFTFEHPEPTKEHR